jgi:hypothetical protein
VQTTGIKIKKCVALSLLIMYMVVSFSNLACLPKYNKHQASTNRITSAGLQFYPVWLYNGANSSSILFHRTGKTIIENKRNLAAFFKTAASVFLLVMAGGCSCLFIITAISYGRRFYPYGRRYACLNFCNLRI